MTLDTLIIFAGALVALLSIAGFPPSLYKPMFFVLGFFVIGLGIIVRRARGERETRERKRAAMHAHQAPSSALHENEMGL